MSKLVYDEDNRLCVGFQSSCCDQIIHDVFNPIDQFPFSGNESAHLRDGMNVIKLHDYDLSACPFVARARGAAIR